MTFDKFINFFKQLDGLCAKYGLYKELTNIYNSYFIKSSHFPLYGEVIRIYTFDIKNPNDNKLLFFNKLKNLKNEQCLYGFERNELTSKLELMDNSIKIDNLTYKEFNIIINKLEVIIKDCIKQKKELEKKIKIERIKNDF